MYKSPWPPAVLNYVDRLRTTHRISARAKKALLRLGVASDRDVVNLSLLERGSVKNCGPVTINELRKLVKQIEIQRHSHVQPCVIVQIWDDMP